MRRFIFGCPLSAVCGEELIAGKQLWSLKMTHNNERMIISSPLVGSTLGSLDPDWPERVD